MRRWMMGGVVALWVAGLAGCSLYRNDRQYIYDSEYEAIRKLYDKCGSVVIVEQILRDREWTRAQINEVRYRLAQDFSLDEKGNPRAIERSQPVAKSRGPSQLAIGSTPRQAEQLGVPY